MRRQRVLRTASASSLCVFCACRLGAIELPAAASSQIQPLQALRSIQQQRNLSTTRAPFQGTASATAPLENGSEALPAWYDPTSSLSMSEQKEKAHRMSMRQQYETEQNEARRARLLKEEQERNRVKQEAEAKRRAERDRNAQAPPQQRRAKSQLGSRRVEISGSTLSQAISSSIQSQGSHRTPRARNGSSPIRKILLKGDGASAGEKPDRAAEQPVRLRLQSGGKRRNLGPKDNELMTKISNPFGGFTVPSGTQAVDPPPSSSGWGSGSTRVAPLEYGDSARATVTSSIGRPDEQVGHGTANPNVRSVGPIISHFGHQKIFRLRGAQSGPPNNDQNNIPQQQASALDTNSGLQAQQDVDGQAAKRLDEASSRSAMPVTAPSNREEVVPVPSSQEETTAAAPNIASFGHFGAEAQQLVGSTVEEQRLPAESQRQPIEPVGTAGQYGPSEVDTAAVDSLEQSELKLQHEDARRTGAQAETLPTPSPLSQMALQTERSMEKTNGAASQSGAQQTAAPDQTLAQSNLPPQAAVPPPPPAAMSAGGQLAWQPIDEHPQGGQWIWQASPPTMPLSSAALQSTILKTQSDLHNSAHRTASNVILSQTPETSISDSGYRATPLVADDFTAQTKIDEEKAANWQHLRRKDSFSTQSSVEASPPLHEQQSPRPAQSVSQHDSDDESWVDQTFNNHLREREQRQRLQREREEERKAWLQAREQRTANRQQDQQQPRAHDAEGHRRLYNGPAQSYRDKECARCGEMGHIARFCTKDMTPFSRENRRRRDFSAARKSGNERAGNPFDAHGARSDRASNPLESRGAENQKPRQGWGADQVIPTEPTNMPKREQSFKTTRAFVPIVDAASPTQGIEVASAPVVQDRAGDSKSSRRAERFEVESDMDESAPATDARISREKAARKSRWVEDEEEVIEEKGRGAGRKAQRAGRREYDEEEDDEAEARDNFRARKAARQAEKEAKEERRRQNARREREVKKAEDATPISIPEFISVQQLSQLLGVRYEQFIDRLEELGYDDVFPSMTLNSETSGMIAMEYNFDPTIDTGVREEEQRDLKPRPEVEDKEFLPQRPPVVTIMGHVDHGKTTILDYLRKSSVAAGEAGGITQHIGAFSVPMASSGKTITFLDTPGHAAFLAMRQRGANVTDIVILVVAADDSVKPQTLEAIKHAKAAGVPMIVAINKVDKEEADIQRVKQDLARHGVEIEDFGGETQVVPVSGKTGKGMDELEETVVALSEVLDQRAETDGAVEGWILEATTKAHGRVATVLVRRGTLRPGAVIVAGKTWARVRSLRNEGGRAMQEVGPGMPVEVDGWRDQPMAGDEVIQATTEQKATSVIEYRQEREEREKAAADIEAINEARRKAAERQQKEREASQALKQAQRTANAEGGTADVANKPDDLDAPQRGQTGQMEVPFIIKADVSGSAEAVSAYIMSVSNPLITPTILQSQVGPVHESDVELANAAGGHIIAFNLPPDQQMRGKAEAQGVKILENNIIYRVLDDVKAVLEEKLPPIISQRVLGEAEVSAAFEISVGGRKKVKIAGCKVRNGMVGKGARVRVTRGSEKVYDGKITSLKNVKKDVTEMRKGSECGMGFDEWEGFEVGDQMQTYEEISEKRKL